MILGVDVSRWQPTIDWSKFKAGGVEFAIIKATQGDYRVDEMMCSHVDAATKAGLIVGLYHWCDPLVDNERQAKYFITNTQGINYRFVAADVEQHWADWKEWSQGRVTRILSPEIINQNAKAILAYWDNHLKTRTVLYSRASFINAYARPMLTWVGKYPLWMAHYPYDSQRIKTTWEIFKSKYKPSISGPNLPAGCKEWTFWQFSGDKFVLPGVETTLDINYFNGDLAALEKFATPQTLTLEERIALLEEEARTRGWAV